MDFSNRAKILQLRRKYIVELTSMLCRRARRESDSCSSGSRHKISAEIIELIRPAIATNAKKRFALGKSMGSIWAEGSEESDASNSSVLASCGERTNRGTTPHRATISATK
jgi:hypothetical protein